MVVQAQRFQLLPVVDRFVVDRAFEILAPHRAVLSAQRITVSINVSGASLCDPEFTSHFITQLKASQLPITVTLERVGTKDAGQQFGYRTGFEGTFEVKRSDYGITWNKALDKGGLALGDDVTVVIKLELNK